MSPVPDAPTTRIPAARASRLVCQTAWVVGAAWLLSLVAVAIAGAQPQSGIVRPTTEPSTPSVQLGAELFSGNCASCHGGDGTAKRARKSTPNIPDFTSLAWQMSQTDLEIAHRIRDGHELSMPAFGEDLSQAEVLALTIYVRGFSIKSLMPNQGPASKDAQAPPAETAAVLTRRDLSELPAARQLGVSAPPPAPDPQPGPDASSLLDTTPYGRQADFEDSPPGWPQKPTYG